MGIESLIIGLIVIGILLIISEMRKGDSALETRPRRVKSFTVKGDPQTVLKIILQFAYRGGYDIEALDEEKGRIVLGESATSVSWGFFYPIFISARPDGKTLVEVGIKSKLFQAGPIVSRSHERCFNGIKAAVFANI